MQCKYRDKLHLLILWKTYEAKSIVQYNRLITLQHGHSRRVRRMKNGGVWRRLAGSLLGTRQIYLCGAVRQDPEIPFNDNLPGQIDFSDLPGVIPEGDEGSMKQVQISEELFTRLYAYFLMDRREPLQERIIKDELQAKFDRIQRRADYIPGKKTGL